MEIYKDLEIVVVNYKTPDLIGRLVNSIRLKYNNLIPIRIIDGSDDEDYVHKLKQFELQDKHLTIEYLGYNIHHGRGLDYAITTSKYDRILCMDSDKYLLNDNNLIELTFELVTEDVYCAGCYCHVNPSGFDCGRNYDDEYPIKYIHPSFLLLNKKLYLKYKEKNNIKFIHHGAPAIQIMKFFYDNKLSDILTKDIMDEHNIELKNYLSTEGRGTVDRFGYNLAETEGLEDKVYLN